MKLKHVAGQAEEFSFAGSRVKGTHSPCRGTQNACEGVALFSFLLYIYEVQICKKLSSFQYHLSFR